MVEIDTLFHTKTAKKTIPFGAAQLCPKCFISFTSHIHAIFKLAPVFAQKLEGISAGGEHYWCEPFAAST